jgi:heme A synthase
MNPSARRFARYAWGVLAWTLLVILWGAFVRASGSGAGCGDHWPDCHDQLVPGNASAATLIEFTHRLTSGLLGLLVLGLVAWAFRVFPKGAGIRAPAVLVGVFTVTEALIGAGLVLFQYVAYNVSVARAYWMVAHLVNTFFLIGALGVLVHRASLQAGLMRAEWLPDFRARTRNAVAFALGSLIVLGASGAVTALADTLVVRGGADPVQDPIVLMLVGLRLYHPLLAFVLGTAVVLACVFVRIDAPDTRAAHLAGWVVGLLSAQMAVGALNVVLETPIWLQLVHLLVTDVIWMGTVVLADLTREIEVDDTAPYAAYSDSAPPQAAER